MLIALPRASLPYAVLITYFAQRANVANCPSISALGEQQDALCAANTF